MNFLYPVIIIFANIKIGDEALMMTKVQKGMAVEGPAFMLILAPCPVGWAYKNAKMNTTKMILGLLIVLMGMVFATPVICTSANLNTIKI